MKSTENYEKGMKNDIISQGKAMQLQKYNIAFHNHQTWGQQDFNFQLNLAQQSCMQKLLCNCIHHSLLLISLTPSKFNINTIE